MAEETPGQERRKSAGIKAGEESGGRPKACLPQAGFRPAPTGDQAG